MLWDEFPYFAVPAALCWLISGVLACRLQPGRRIDAVDLLMWLGFILFGTFIALLWQGLERPPLRTMGETRLWYAFFVVLAGYLAGRRWLYPWVLLLSVVMATAFIGVNLLKPELHSMELMPALQSPYFIPHVTVYILAYALFGVVTLAACVQLWRMHRGQDDMELFVFMDDLVQTGFALLALGLLLGAFWAKEAWGHYWSWDPKETLAFITGAAYLVYIHLRHQGRRDALVVWTLPMAFLLLLVGWMGTKLFPATQYSLHLYAS